MPVNVPASSVNEEELERLTEGLSLAESTTPEEGKQLPLPLPRSTTHCGLTAGNYSLIASNAPPCSACGHAFRALRAKGQIES